MRIRARLAASVALRIASGTSRALPWPKPTRPFWSPTTTKAAKPKRRPPFTTLATRLMWTSLSTNSLGSRSPPRSRPPPSRSRLASRAITIFSLLGRSARHHPLEVQPALARGIAERLDPAVVAVAAPVEHDILDAFLDGALGHQRADRLGGFDIGARLRAHVLLQRRGRRQRLALHVVDHLGIDVLTRAVHGKPLAPVGGGLHGAPHGRLAAQGPISDSRHRALRYFFLPSLRKMYSPAYFTPLPL